MGEASEPPDRDFTAKVISLILAAMDSWPRTLRLCLILAAGGIYFRDNYIAVGTLDWKVY